MKKRLMALTMAAAMVFTTACSGGGTASPTEAAKTEAAKTEAAKTEAASTEEQTTEAEITEPVTIKFANYALLEQGYEEFWNGVKTDFEAKNPNITIEWVTAPYGEIVNQVINMAGGGDRIDMIFGEIGWVPGLADAGLTIPVDEVLPADYLADFYPAILDSFNIDGKPYGLPMYVSPYVLYYNTELFEQAGLDPNSPPATYDEMLEYAEKLSQLKDSNGNPVYAFGQTTASVPVSGSSINGMIFNFGGTLLADDGSLSIDNQGFKDSITMLKTLDEKGYNPQNAKLKDLRNLFALGQLAMYYDQSWGFNGIQSINPDAKKFTASAKPLAGGSGTGESILQAHCLMYVDNGDAQKAACSKLTQYLVTSEVLNDYLANITPAYPAKKSMEGATGTNPVLAGAAGSAENVKAQVFVPQISDIKSFTKYQIKNIISGKPGTWNNFGNYIKLFQNAKLPQAITNTFIFVIVVVLSAFILGMALSLILNGGVKGAKIIQGVMMTPWVIPTVISALIWMWLFQPQYGLIKYLASLVTGGAVSNLAVLNNPKTALMGISVAALWKQVPLMTLLLLAGLQNVSEELLEAATVDGANRVQKFFHITLPSMKSVISIAVSMSIIENFKQFPLFWTMTGGGPDGATTTLAILSYREAFVSQDLGSGAAVTTVWMLLMIGVIFIYNKVLNTKADE